MTRFTFSRYTPNAEGAVYDVLANGCATGFRPSPDKAAAAAYLERAIAEAPGRVEVTYWDGDAGEERDTADELGLFDVAPLGEQAEAHMADAMLHDRRGLASDERIIAAWEPSMAGRIGVPFGWRIVASGDLHRLERTDAMPPRWQETRTLSASEAHGLVAQLLAKGEDAEVAISLDTIAIVRHGSDMASATDTKETSMTINQQETKTPSPAKLAQLRAAYLVAFDNFATDRSEVANVLNVSKAVATSLLKKLAGAGLIDSYDVNDEAQGTSRRGQYQELTWQCNETYDSISRGQAEWLFDVAFGLVAEEEPDQQTTSPASNLETPVSYTHAVTKARKLLGPISGKVLVDMGVVTQDAEHDGGNGKWYVNGDHAELRELRGHIAAQGDEAGFDTATVEAALNAARAGRELGIDLPGRGEGERILAEAADELGIDIHAADAATGATESRESTEEEQDMAKSADKTTTRSRAAGTKTKTRSSGKSGSKNATAAMQTVADKVDTKQLHDELLKKIKSSVRGVTAKASPKGSYTTIKVGVKPVAYLNPRAKAVVIHLGLTEKPEDVKLDMQPYSGNGPRFALQTKVTTTEQIEEALKAIEAAAVLVAK